jgi:hypothetical protein
VIREAELEFNTVSFRLLTHDKQQDHELKEATRDGPFARTSIYLHPGYAANETTNRDERHDDASQKARRGEIARLRNYLMLRTLRHETDILWLDADIYRLSPGIVPANAVSHLPS